MSNDSSKTTELTQVEQVSAPVQAPGSAAAYTDVPWSPWVAVAYAVIVYFMAQFLAKNLVLSALRLGGVTDPGPDMTTFASFLFTALATGLTFAAVLWFVRLRRSSLRAIGWRRLRLPDPLYAVAGFAVYFLAFALLLVLARSLFPALNIDQKQELGFDTASASSISLVLTFFSLVILPPLLEETVFRGFVFTGLRTKLRPFLATILTSLLFAAPHLQFGSGKPLLWVAGLDTFTLSLVLCYLRDKTSSLWPGILIHALKNSVAFVGLFLLHQ